MIKWDLREQRNGRTKKSSRSKCKYLQI